MRAQHDGLAAALSAEGVEVVYAEQLAAPLFNGIFTRDPLMTVPRRRDHRTHGPAATPRRGGEHPSHRLRPLGCRCYARSLAAVRSKADRFVKIRPDVAAVGISVRCNEDAADQLEDVLVRLGVELIRVPLNGYSIHLDGHLAMLDQDKALVDGARLPHWFLDRLRRMGIGLIWRHPEEDWAVNCIATRPGRVIMSDSSPRTQELLERHGVEVITVPYDEVQKFSGGVHCSTMELLREPAATIDGPRGRT